MKIRPIQPDDAKDVKSLISNIMIDEFSNEIIAYTYDDLDNLAEHYGGKREIFLIAEKNGKIIGTVAIKEDGDRMALLRRIFVHKDYRGKGYGAKLLAKVMEFCFEHNYKTVTFRGTDKMQTALQLCLKNGFKKSNISELGDFQLVELCKSLKENDL